MNGVKCRSSHPPTCELVDSAQESDWTFRRVPLNPDAPELVGRADLLNPERTIRIRLEWRESEPDRIAAAYVNDRQIPLRLAARIIRGEVLP